MAYAVLHMTKINAGNFGGKIKHNSRDMKQTEKNRNIDFSKSNENIYDGIKTLQEFCAYKAENINPLVTRKDNVIVNEIVLTASPEFFQDKSKGEVVEWYQHNIEFLKGKFGDKYIGSSLHLDETTPHIHAYVVPVQVAVNKEGKEEKKLNSREMFNRQNLIALQDDYPKFLRTKGYELQRGEPDLAVKHTDQKEYSTAINKAIRNEAKQEKAFINGIESIVDAKGIKDILNFKEVLKDELRQYTKANFRGAYYGGVSAKKNQQKVSKLSESNQKLRDDNQGLEAAKNEALAGLEGATKKLQQTTRDFEVYKKTTDEKLAELNNWITESKKLKSENNKLLVSNRELKTELLVEKVKKNPESFKDLQEQYRNNPQIAYEAIKADKNNSRHMGKFLKDEIGNNDPLKHLEKKVLQIQQQNAIVLTK